MTSERVEEKSQMPVAAPELDTQALSALARNDAQKIHRLCMIFIESTRSSLAQMGEAQKAGNLSVLAEIGHRQKSSSRSMGAARLADQFECLEMAAKHGDTTQVEAAGKETLEIWQRIENELAVFLADKAA